MTDTLKFVKTAAKVKAATTGAAVSGGLAGLTSGLALAAAIPSTLPADMTQEDALSTLARLVLVSLGVDPTVAALLAIVLPTVIGAAAPALGAFWRGWWTPEPAANVAKAA